MTIEHTDWASLHVIAKRRGIPDPQDCTVICGECGSPLTQFGILHFPDCNGAWESVAFTKRNAAGQWYEVGARSLDQGGLTPTQYPDDK